MQFYSGPLMHFLSGVDTDAHSIEEFRDPTTIAHVQLVDIVQRIARGAQMRPLDG